MTKSLRRVVEHPGRLDVLVVLDDDDDPLTTGAISDRTRQSIAVVSHYLKLLADRGVVRSQTDRRGVVRFEIRLEGHPHWVRGAVEDHRRRGKD